MIQVEGVQVFTALARALKTYGDKGLRSEFYAGINSSTKPLIADVRTSAINRLPSKGGLGPRVAKSKITTKRRMSGKAAGVRISGASTYDLRSIDRGRVRHPVFGHPPWVNQKVKPGFWTEPLQAGAPQVRRALEKVLNDIARKLGGG